MFPRSLLISWFSNHLNRAISKAGSSLLHIRWFMVAAFLVPFLLSSGCGYRFSPGGEYIDKNIRTVFVDTFANRTSEALIENTFRSAFIDQFVIGGRFTLVDSRGKADAIFKGTIVSLITSPVSYQRSNVAAEERVTVTMELTFEDQENKKPIWTNNSFSGYQDYACPDLSAKETNRRNALTKLSTDTADKAYRSMMSGF